MPNQVYAFFLIILAALPGFSAKSELENRVAQLLLGDPNQISAHSDYPSKTIPLKIDPMSDARANAKSAYFIDLESGEVLYAKNENQKMPIASTTKLMTAIVASETLKPNQVITVGTLHTLPLDAVMGLKTGDKLKASELMHGLLIESGADAAEALAVASAGSEPKFVAHMNETAAHFGMTETQFSNPIGDDDTDNRSTAKDLSKLARLAISNKEIKSIVAKKSYVATAENGQQYYLSNTNALLSNPNYIGVKTGTTFDAGECLVVLYNDGTRKILGVVLDSPERFSDTKNIIEWTKTTFRW